MHFKDDQRLSFFEPDTLSSGRYFETHRSRSPVEAEKQLIRAVLEDALVCFHKYFSAQDRRGKTLFLEAENWIFAADHEGIFSFDHVCEVSGIAPNYLRRCVLNWKEKQPARTPKPKSWRPSARRPRFAAARCAPHPR